MKWPEVPFDREVIEGSFPKDVFKIFNDQNECTGIGVFDRVGPYIVMKINGFLPQVEQVEDDKYKFYAENPEYLVSFEGFVELRKRGSHKGMKSWHEYQEVAFCKPITTEKILNSMTNITIEPGYLYFEIFNLSSGFKEIQEEIQEPLNVFGRKLWIKLLPNNKRSPSNKYQIDAIGAFELPETTGEELMNAEDVIRKISTIMSLFFMNFIDVGSFMWVEKRNYRLYKKIKIAPYLIRTGIKPYHVCFYTSNKGELVFSSICRNLNYKKMWNILENFIAGIDKAIADELDLVFLKENIAGARNEMFVEYQIVKYAIALEKLHTLLGNELGILCSPPTEKCVKKIYNSIPILGNGKWFSIQKDIYDARNSIVHGNIKKYLQSSNTIYQILNELPALVGNLLAVLSKISSVQ